MRYRVRAALTAALLVAAGVVATVIGSSSPAAAHAVNPADFQQVELARGSAKWVSR